jgi:general secretion pathway protein G
MKSLHFVNGTPGGERRRNLSRGVATRESGRDSGFTLIELMIVISIILILIGMAAGMYQRSIQHAREATLKQDLVVMRTAIDNFTMDKQQAPQSLDDLVDSHYLREVPLDPISRQKDWVPHFSDTVLSPDQSGSGIDDVFSGSDQVGSDGKPYNSW